MSPDGISSTYIYAVYYKIATSSEPASYGFVPNTTNRSVGCILRISGIDTSNPVNVFGALINSGTTYTAPSVITDVDDCLLVRATQFERGNSLAGAWSGSVTELFDLPSGSLTNGCNLAVGWDTQAIAGATSAETQTGSGDIGCGMTIAIAPVSVAPPGPPTIDSITPDFGPPAGGTEIVIIGEGFTGVTDIKFGGEFGASALDLDVVSDTEITCTTPAHADGLVDLYFVNPTSGDALAEGAFDYRPYNHLTQVPVLVVMKQAQGIQLTQAPILVINKPLQNARLTQSPVSVVWSPTPIPLPLPIVPEVPVKETWEWKTIINIAERNKEQRSALRAHPRTNMSFSAYILNDSDRRDVYQMMFKYIGMTFNYPIYVYSTKLSAAAITGETKLYFDPAATNLRDNEVVALFDRQLDKTMLLTLSTVDADGGTLTSPLQFDVPEHFLICPAPAFLVKSPSFSMNSIDGDFTLSLEGAQVRDVLRPNQSSALLTTVDSLLVLDKRPLANSGNKEDFDQNITWLDNEVANPEPRTSWSYPSISGDRSYLIHRPLDLDYWRAVSSYMKGKQKTFLLPTFRNDLPLYETPVLGATEFKSSNFQFSEFWRSKSWKYLRIQSDAGTIYRKINEVITNYDTSGQPVSITVKLSASIGAGAGSNSNMVVSFVNTCRLDDDKVVIEHDYVDSVITLKIRAVEE
jgi:hypothetical protein